MGTITREPGGRYTLQWEQRIPLPLDVVFRFFASAANLEAITPPFLRFSMQGPVPGQMQRGTIIRYRLRLFGIPVYWRTLISEWEPPLRFVDIQQKGPYRLWRHEHTFRPVEGGTLMRDVVEYHIPLGILGHVAQRLFVRRQLMAIWRYRERKIDELVARWKANGGEDIPAKS